MSRARPALLPIRRPALHVFSPRLAETLRHYDRGRFLGDLGAGLTVGVVALPLAMAFAIASGVKPEQGLFTAIVAGLLISALGGSSVQIGGPAGAFVVIVYGIVQRHGVGGLLAATMMAGVLLLAMGWLRLGALVRYIPASVVAGFTNGIAVLIALSQLKDLLGLPIAHLPAGFFPQVGALATHVGEVNPYSLALGMACLAGLFLWARLPGVRSFPGGLPAGRMVAWAARIPGPIVALATLTALATMLELPVETIGTRFGGIPRSLPAVALPALDWSGAQQLFIPALTLAGLGAIESLLCARVADGLVRLPRHDPNQELMAQGIANVVGPLFGGIPATGTIARTVTNVRAGASSPVAGIVHAVALLGIVLAAAPLAAHVPLAVLAGILLFVAWNMLDLHEFRRLAKLGFEPGAKFLSTFVLTVVLDLTVAVEVGLVLACVFFVARMSTLFEIEDDATVEAPAGVVVRRVYGALFFGAVSAIETLADRLPEGTRVVVLEAHHLVAIDASGLRALEQLQQELHGRDQRLVICGLHRQPLARLRDVAPDLQADLPLLWADLDGALRAAAAHVAE